MQSSTDVIMQQGCFYTQNSTVGLSINLTWHSSECKEWHSKFIPYSKVVLDYVGDDQKWNNIESGILTREYNNEI